MINLETVEQPANDGLGPRRCASAIRVPAAERRRRQRERRGGEGVVSEKWRGRIVDGMDMRLQTAQQRERIEQCHSIKHHSLSNH